MMAGVPNTAFTEALAFVFQKRDLQLLGIENNDPEKDKMDILDKFWSLYEIMGSLHARHLHLGMAVCEPECDG